MYNTKFTLIVIEREKPRREWGGETPGSILRTEKLHLHRELPFNPLLGTPRIDVANLVMEGGEEEIRGYDLDRGEFFIQFTIDRIGDISELISYYLERGFKNGL